MCPSFLVIIFGVSYLAMIISGPICQKYIGFVTLPIWWRRKLFVCRTILLFPLQRYGKFSHQNFASNVCSWKQLLLKLVQTKFISIFINVFELVIGPSLKWNPAVVLGFVKISLIDMSFRFDFWVGGRGSRPNIF